MTGICALPSSRTSRAHNESADLYDSNVPGRREADRLAGGAAFEAWSHELAFAGVNTRTRGSVELTKPSQWSFVDFLLTRLADNLPTRWANGALQPGSNLAGTLGSASSLAARKVC
jgi:hypothetical protein